MMLSSNWSQKHIYRTNAYHTGLALHLSYNDMMHCTVSLRQLSFLLQIQDEYRRIPSVTDEN